MSEVKLYTRRDLAKLATVGIVVGTAGGAGGVMRSMLGLRGGMMNGGGGAWVNPYITYGLIAMWDGEWNAGGGVHDASLDSLVDLSGGGHDMTFVGTHSLGAKSVTIDGVSGAYGSINGLTWGPESTQEFAVNVTSVQGYGRLIAEGKGLCVTQSAGGFNVGHCYGFNADAPIGSYVTQDFGELVQCALTFDEDRIIRFYANGDLSGERLSQTFTSVFSGQTTFFNRTSGSRGISGRLHSVRLYSRALTSQEVAANYAVDKERFGLT